MTRIGERLRVLCTQSGLSPHDLEEAAGLEAGCVSRIIEGRDVSTCDPLGLGRLAVALEVPLERMFYVYEEGEIAPTSKAVSLMTIEHLAEDRTQQQPLGIADVIAAVWRFGRVGSRWRIH